MNHNEAKQTMAPERYLLGELTPQETDAFEEHMFDCADCALDVRVTDAFMREAQEQLQHLPTGVPAPAANKPLQRGEKKTRWFVLFRPMFATPVFATLLGLIAYQNLSVIPSLRSEAMAPRILPSLASFHVGARGGEAASVLADRKQGALVMVQLPQNASYSAYSFRFSGANGKEIWSERAPAPGPSSDGSLSLAISPIGLQSGSYTLAIAGISPNGELTEIDRRALNVRFEP